MEDNLLPMIPSRPVRADAVKNYRLLLETARRLFKEQGVAAVSMTQLAEEAGVGKGTLYRHFNNKMDVCYALLDEDQRALQDTTLQRLRRSQTPYDDLLWFMEQAAQFVINNTDLLACGEDPNSTITLDIPAHIWWRQTIIMLLDRLHVDGDVEYLGDVLYVMLHVNTIHFQRKILKYDTERIVNGLLSTVQRLYEKYS